MSNSDKKDKFSIVEAKHNKKSSIGSNNGLSQVEQNNKYEKKKKFASFIIVFLMLCLLSGFLIGRKATPPITKQATTNNKVENESLVEQSNDQLSPLPSQIISVPKPTNLDFCVTPNLVTATDGDTLQIIKLNNKKPQRIRLIGIDTPELAQKPFGDQAKQQITKLLSLKKGEKVCCKKGEETTDKYGRTLAYCWAGDKFLNSSMLENGQAVTLFVGDKNNKYKTLFMALEEQAEEQGLGIHDMKNPLKELPSDWRKQHKKRV